MRRVPVGEHRPETVIARLSASLESDRQRLADVEARVSAFDDALADLDAVVADAANLRDQALADAAAAVSQRAENLRVALGIPPAGPSTNPVQ